MKGHGARHEHLIISPTLPASSKHSPRPAAASSKKPARYSRRHLIRSSRTVRATEARQNEPRHRSTSKAWPRRQRHTTGNDIMRQTSSPVGSTSPPDTERWGEERDDEGRTGKGKTMTTGDIAERQATQLEPMTSPITSSERTRHEQLRENEPSDEKKKAEPMTSPTRKASKKSQHSRIIPEEMLNSGANRNYTKMTGNETQPGKQ